jgi:FkbM family methyltransferase
MDGQEAPGRAPRTDAGLIFDLGVHAGLDTRYYLDKGFRVVGLEANPGFVAAAERTFAREIAGGQLTLVARALWERGGEEVSFFVNDVKDGWSSLYRPVAEREGLASREIRVATVTVAELFDRHGVPHYLKADIEGADDIVVAQIAADGRRPAFLSVEVDAVRSVHLLRDAGYDRFQLVNQGHHPRTRPPRPAREGRFVDVRFDGRMSGLFGRELDPRFWCDWETAAARLQRWLALRDAPGGLRRYVARRWGKLTGRLWLVPSGWLDVHATTAAELRRAEPQA